jgi:hypothetical protein
MMERYRLTHRVHSRLRYAAAPAVGARWLAAPAGLAGCALVDKSSKTVTILNVRLLV